jgi:hypothetical protein
MIFLSLRYIGYYIFIFGDIANRPKGISSSSIVQL